MGNRLTHADIATLSIIETIRTFSPDEEHRRLITPVLDEPGKLNAYLSQLKEKHFQEYYDKVQIKLDH